MSRHFNPLEFIRHAPMHLLKVYFEERKLLPGFEWEPDPSAETLLQAITTLGEHTRGPVLFDFQELHQRSRDGGFVRAILDESGFHGIDPNLAETFAGMKNALEKAFWVFLYRKEEYWDGSNVIWRVDKITSRNRWDSRLGLPARPGDVDEGMVEELRQQLIKHFSSKEGRGQRCKVEAYRRGAEEIFYAYPEDYGTTVNEYTGDDLEARPAKFAFEIIFRHVDSERRLDIFSEGAVSDVGELQVIFARAVLNEEIDADYEFSPPVYDLDRLLESDFDFQWPDDTGIRAVFVRTLRVILESDDFQRITIEADPKRRERATYDLLSAATSEISEELATVDHAILSVVFHRGPNDRRTPTRTVHITTPHTCRMNHDERGEHIHRMLVQSGIEIADSETTTNVSD